MFQAEAERLTLRSKFLAKLLAAQAAAQPVKPSGSFQAGPLKDKPYVSDHDTTEQLTPILREHGLVLTCSMVSSKDVETEIGKNKNRGWLYTAVVQFELSDAETGYGETYLVEGRALTDDNRGPVHAIANASRVFLMRLLQVPMAEPDSNRGQQGRARQQRSGPTMADGRDGRISQARGIQFDRSPLGEWSRRDTGESLRLCGKCKKYPVLELQPNEFACISELCGNRVKLFDSEPAEQPSSSTRPAPQAQQPPAGQVKAQEEDELAVTQSTLEALVRKLNVHPWQIDAIRLAHPKLPDNPDDWQKGDYQILLELLQRDAPSATRRAVAAMAKLTPADPRAVAHLRQLVGKAPREKVSLAERAVAEEVAVSGWHDAVVDMIHKLENTLNQGELPIGGGRNGQ